MQNMEWICPPNFLGKSGKVERLAPDISIPCAKYKVDMPTEFWGKNWEVRGTRNFFVQLGDFEYSKIKS